MCNTTKYNQSLTREEQIKATKKSKGGSWYSDDYTPYCASPICEESPDHKAMPRMERMSYGFCCGFCGNMIGWNMERLEESPLN